MFQKYAILQYFPLTLFIWLIRFKYDWSAVFITAGICAFAFLLILLKQKNVIDKFVLAMYCFLIAGAAMFLFNIVWLQKLYTYFDKAMLLIWFFFVQLFSTIIMPAKFIETESVNKQNQKLCSYAFLIVVSIILILALRNKENIFLAGMIPFMALRISQIILKSLLTRHK